MSHYIVLQPFAGEHSDDHNHELPLPDAAAAPRLPGRPGARSHSASEQLLRGRPHARDEEALLQPARERSEFSTNTFRAEGEEAPAHVSIKLFASPDIRRHRGGSETSGQILDHKCSGEVLALAFRSVRLVPPTPAWPPVRVSVSPVQSGQTCCLMRLVLRFYIERVFGNYPSPQPQDRRCCSALANAFITIRRSIHKCVSASWQPAARLAYECHWAGGNNRVSRSCAELQLLGGNTEDRRLSANEVRQGETRLGTLTNTLGVGRYHSELQMAL